MDGMNDLNAMYTAASSTGEKDFWGLPVAFAMEADVRDKINSMSDEERDALRAKSGQVKSEAELGELVRMVAEGKFE